MATHETQLYKCSSELPNVQNYTNPKIHKSERIQHHMELDGEIYGTLFNVKMNAHALLNPLFDARKNCRRARHGAVNHFNPTEASGILCVCVRFDMHRSFWRVAHNFYTPQSYIYTDCLLSARCTLATDRVIQL